MVVWEDRGVLKPPKPPTVHATAYGWYIEVAVLLRAGIARVYCTCTCIMCIYRYMHMYIVNLCGSKILFESDVFVLVNM